MIYCRYIYIYIYKYQIVKKVLSLHSRKCFSKHVHISDISRNLSHFQVCNFHQLYIYWYFISAMFVLLLFFQRKNVLGSDKDMYCFISFSQFFLATHLQLHIELDSKNVKLYLHSSMDIKQVIICIFLTTRVTNVAPYNSPKRNAINLQNSTIVLKGVM